jgi:predicted 2-oxoglutarate/Fe(II)-dependent dioxygenase YbiX
MHFAADSFLQSISLSQQPANAAGRERCRTGTLARSAQTRALNPADYAGLDFIVVENFLGPADLAELRGSFAALRSTLNAKNLNNDYWQGRLLFAHEVAAHSMRAGQVMKDFQLEATHRIERFYRLTQPIYADTVQLVLWSEGIHMPPHADNANPDGSPHGMAWRNFSSIVYLNDDYDGGELYFTALDAYIKPKAGMLVAFTAGFHHEHSVLKVLSGERLTMPAFYTFDRSHADFFIHPGVARQP